MRSHSASLSSPRRQRQEHGRRGRCGPLTRMARLVAALGHRLVGAAPVGPAQQEGAPRGISGQREREAAHLGHGQRDQLWLVP